MSEKHPSGNRWLNGMCARPMSASTLERRRGGMSQRAGVVDRGHGTLSPCGVGVREGRCYRRWCVAGLLRPGIGPRQEVGDESRGRCPRGRPVAVKVKPGRGTGGWRSRGAQRVLRAPSRFKCSAHRRNGDEGHQRARQWAPVIEVVPAEQEGAGERAMGPWCAVIKGGPVGGW